MKRDGDFDNPRLTLIFTQSHILSILNYVPRFQIGKIT